MVHIFGRTPPAPEPDDSPIDPHVEHLDELLDKYASATGLHAFAEAGALRGEIVAFFQNHRMLQDGEFIIEGMLFGVFFRSRGRMTARQYRDPVIILEFMGQLVEKLVTGIGRYLEQARRGSSPSDHP